jgi:hypothetical protein
MNFYIDSGGTVIATDPERVFQGSAMANTIRLIAPFPLGASVTVSYILPDGTQMQPQLMTANKTLSGIQTETGVNFSVWEQNIGVRFEQVNGAAKAVPDFTVLSQVGKVGVVFAITQANAAGQPITQTTARSSFLCEKGSPLVMPPEAFDDYESLLNQILGQLSIAVGLETSKVNRAGDDKMTGEFVVTNGRILFKKDPSEGHYAWLDQDMLWFNTGLFDGIAYTWKGISYAWREENDPTKQYTALISIPKKSGTMAIQEDIAPQIAQNASAIDGLKNGKVNRAGDTMQGPLTVDDPSTAGDEYTDYTAQGIEIADEHNRDYTAYKKDSIYREINDGDGFTIYLPNQGGTLARESQIQDAEEWISSAIDGIREDIRNEAHFRGYVATNAEIQALAADDNDYAYSAESGTVWIYQGNAWTNSGRPVPDQSTPASNSTPLMDGTASAGTAEAYARGDHVHPTDTTLAKTIDGQILTLGDGSKNVNLRLYNTEGKLINSVTFALPDFVTKSEVGLGGTIYFFTSVFDKNLSSMVQGYWIAKHGNLPRIGDLFMEASGNVFKIDKVPEDGGNIELSFLFNYNKSGSGEGGTTVTVDGVAQETWDADTKVDKMTNTAAAANLSQAYIITPNQEVQLLTVTEWGASPNTLAKRDNSGRIAVATPSGNNDAANKKYVDNMVLGVDAESYSSLDEMAEDISAGEYPSIYELLSHLWQNRNN